MKFGVISFFVTLFVFVGSVNAMEPVRIRADAKVVDVSGRVIGEPNPRDSRNNKYETYYRSVDNGGNYSNGSVFKVTTNPHLPIGGGFVRFEVQSEEAQQEQYSGANNNGDVMEYDIPQTTINRDKTVSYNNSNVEKSRYDFGGAQPSRYGDF